MFISPMLASPLKKDLLMAPNQWAAEEKIDGIRIGAHIEAGQSSLFVDRKIVPWSRLGNIHPLPTHILEELGKFPYCYLDGELYVPGLRSYGATEIANRADLIYSVFDILIYEGNDVTPRVYDDRRALLEKLPWSKSVVLTASTQVNTAQEVEALRDAVWQRDGEGLILKFRRSSYDAKKRSKHWIKIKQLQSAVLKVIRFEPSRGLINDRGPCAMAVLQDTEGNITTVKTRNDALCRELEAMYTGGGTHPMVGRLLRIEFQERTPDGNYRHPRWDRWEDE